METVRLDWGGLRILATSRLERELRSRSAAKEKETVAWLEDNMHTGDVLYDIGANVGAYTLIAATLGARVVAFEPDLLNAAHLRENADLNRLRDKVTIVPVALGDTTRLTRLSEGVEAGETHHLTSDQADMPIVCWQLDHLREALDLPVPKWVKIDVDGSELAALAGMLVTLLNVQGLLVEVCAETMFPVGQLLLGQDFTLAAGYLHRSGVTNQIWERV